MSDSNGVIKRSSTPAARRHNDRMIEVSFELSSRPDQDWEREFERAQEGAGVALTARVTLPDQQRSRTSPSVAGPRVSTVDFFIGAPEELAGAVEALDRCIATASQRYRDVVLPAREERRLRDEEHKAQQASEQAQLDDIASQLPPP